MCAARFLPIQQQQSQYGYIVVQYIQCTSTAILYCQIELCMQRQTQTSKKHSQRRVLHQYVRQMLAVQREAKELLLFKVSRATVGYPPKKSNSWRLLVGILLGVILLLFIFDYQLCFLIRGRHILLLSLQSIRTDCLSLCCCDCVANKKQTC